MIFTIVVMGDKCQTSEVKWALWHAKTTKLRFGHIKMMKSEESLKDVHVGEIMGRNSTWKDKVKELCDRVATIRGGFK